MGLLLQKAHVAVSTRVELVVLAIGNVTWSLEFDLALQISAALKHHARVAKACAGDDSRIFAVAGILHDASAPKTRRQRWAEALPERLRGRDVAVNNRGQLVTLRIGPTTATIPYKDAQRIAKWLRMRGKQAKNRTGERAHWSQIVEAGAL